MPPKTQTRGSRSGKNWTPSEDAILEGIVGGFPGLSWGDVAKKFNSASGAGRSITACRDRWRLLHPSEFDSDEETVVQASNTGGGGGGGGGTNRKRESPSTDTSSSKKIKETDEELTEEALAEQIAAHTKKLQEIKSKREAEEAKALKQKELEKLPDQIAALTTLVTSQHTMLQTKLDTCLNHLSYLSGTAYTIAIRK